MPNLSTELFQARTGIKLVAVPYRSGGELATAVLSQAVDASIGDIAAMLPLVREGRLRALAVTSRTRTPLAPEIPTMMEAGVPDYEVTTFFGIVAPAGTPDEIVSKLNTTLNEGLKTPEAQALIKRIGVVSQPISPQEFAAFIKAKREQWTAAAKAIGAKVN
jgi:tripartite-type tricarboxylate transporter receptor subunit TctC